LAGSTYLVHLKSDPSQKFAVFFDEFRPGERDLSDKHVLAVVRRNLQLI